MEIKQGKKSEPCWKVIPCRKLSPCRKVRPCVKLNVSLNGESVLDDTLTPVPINYMYILILEVTIIPISIGGKIYYTRSIVKTIIMDGVEYLIFFAKERSVC